MSNKLGGALQYLLCNELNQLLVVFCDDNRNLDRKDQRALITIIGAFTFRVDILNEINQGAEELLLDTLFRMLIQLINLIEVIKDLFQERSLAIGMHKLDEGGGNVILHLGICLSELGAKKLVIIWACIVCRDSINNESNELLCHLIDQRSCRLLDDNYFLRRLRHFFLLCLSEMSPLSFVSNAARWLFTKVYLQADSTLVLLTNLAQTFLFYGELWLRRLKVSQGEWPYVNQACLLQKWLWEKFCFLRWLIFNF